MTFSQIQPFLGIFVSCPVSFRPEKGAPGPKNEKMSPDIHPRNKCTKLQPNPIIIGLSRLPRSFSGQFGPEKEASGPKMKKNTPPDIHPRNKCTKFQPFLGSLGYPKVLCAHTNTQTLSDSSSTEVEN